jgi:Flp pilus assembly secretin CpaC
VGGFHARGVTVTHHLGGDIPVIGRLFRNEISRGDNMDVLVFVTPVIIDPAGNPIHVMPQ